MSAYSLLITLVPKLTQFPQTKLFRFDLLSWKNSREQNLFHILAMTAQPDQTTVVLRVHQSLPKNLCHVVFLSWNNSNKQNLFHILALTAYSH